ncbi:hypothetical protein [Fusobacterium russii]|uniref:hypothetical protein n=1 Tax=Fusobacterium russii TaxID=854 RepID=UPI00039A32B6|nr:hypothetical protein [Fusobacterium russii]
MKKNIFKIFVLVCVFSLFACKKESKEVNETKENNVVNETVEKKKQTNTLNFTKKYVDFYNQDGNAFVEIYFNDESFLPKEVLDELTVINVGDEKNFTDVINLLFINVDDRTDYKIKLIDGYNVQEDSLTTFSLERGEAFLARIDKLNVLDSGILISAEKNNKFLERDIIFDYELNEEVKNLQQVIIWETKKNEENINEKLIKNDDSKQLNYNAKLDLDGDGKEDELSFVSEFSPYETDKEKGKLVINGKEFLLEELRKNSGIEFGKTAEIYDIELTDINAEDMTKEICLKCRIDDELYIDSALFFSYKNERLEFLGEIPIASYYHFKDCINPSKSELIVPREKNLVEFFEESTLPEFKYFETYSFDGNKITKIKKDKIDIFSVASTLYDNRRLVVKINDDAVSLYEDSDFNSFRSKTQENDIFIFLETYEDKPFIKVKRFSDNKYYYISISDIHNLSNSFETIDKHSIEVAE